ncbi:MAG: GNAT family N-acetyltransferase [Candidatus Bathyarchaeia archaeon]|jgi:GNAT superfamily N-acetyltransferase
MTEFKISLADPEDTEFLVKHRGGMWKDIRPELCEKAKEMEDLTRDWIKTKLSEGKLIGFIARTQTGVVAGSGCIWLRDDAPRPFNPCLEAPYLMSIYTEEGFRRAGVARMIVQCAIEWSREHGYKTISLHASGAGIPLYERFGFKPTTEMRLML